MATAALIYDLQLVRSTRAAEGGTALTFADGQRLFLPVSHPDYPKWLIHLGSRLRATVPVGVVADESGQVLDLNTAHDTTVAWVCELPENPRRFRVGFWAHSPVCGLVRGQPEFDRIYATLKAAAAASRRLWVVTHTSETVDDGPDEDGLSAALPKILDVRPA